MRVTHSVWISKAAHVCGAPLMGTTAYQSFDQLRLAGNDSEWVQNAQSQRSALGAKALKAYVEVAEQGLSCQNLIILHGLLASPLTNLIEPSQVSAMCTSDSSNVRRRTEQSFVRQM